MMGVVALVGGSVQIRWWEWAAFLVLMTAMLVLAAVAWWRGWFDADMAEDATARQTGADGIGVLFFPANW